MTQIILTAILIFLLLPLPLIIISALANRKELSKRGARVTASDFLMSVITTELSLFLTILTRPIFFIGWFERASKKKRGQPILMVHGLYHNDTAWLLIKPRLKNAGFKNFNTWSYNSFTTSYPDLLIELRKKILKLYAENNNQKLLLIGHSLGGLLMTGAIADEEVAGAVEKLITLGTPCRGSLLAIAAPGKLGQSLHPDSSLFKYLRSIPSPAGVDKTAIISPVDEMVLPWENLQPYDTSWKVIRSPAMGHVSMLYSRKVAKIISKILKQ